MHTDDGGDAIGLVSQEETVEDKNEKTVVRRTQAVTTNNFEMPSENNVEACFYMSFENGNFR